MTAKSDTLSGNEPLIDVHAHFYSPMCNRADWERYNRSRLDAGSRIGVVCHVASVLGSWGYTSPTYFASPEDQLRANSWLFDMVRQEQNRVRAYVAVNPNFTAHALSEITRGQVNGAIGIKLAAARRADDVLLDEIASAAASTGLPILQHVWQHRRREWPNQDASDGTELARLAVRHPRVNFMLAHIGGGGDWAHTPAAIVDLPNVLVDLSGSGIDRGMLDYALEWLGARRLLWAADLTLCTGLTKLRALSATGASSDDIADIRWRNAVRVFGKSAFESILNAKDMESIASAGASR